MNNAPLHSSCEGDSLERRNGNGKDLQRLEGAGVPDQKCIPRRPGETRCGLRYRAEDLGRLSPNIGLYNRAHREERRQLETRATRVARVPSGRHLRRDDILLPPRKEQSDEGLLQFSDFWPGEGGLGLAVLRSLVKRSSC